ncbi:palindromic element RPE4 domain-containing protein [Parvularcula marina]
MLSCYQRFLDPAVKPRDDGW